MTTTKRWLDELPLESSERELLLVGKAARPAHGAIDANWQALSLALNTAAVTTGTSAIAVQSASGKVSTSLATSKVAGAGLWIASAKSLAIGAAVGLAVVGTGDLVDRSSRREERPATVSEPTQARTPPAVFSGSLPAPIAARPDEAVAPAGTARVATSAPARQRAVVTGEAQHQADAPSSASGPLPADKTASLSQQARELAELKRLIDSGASSEALRRLETSFNSDSAPALSEERDALYVQALDRAQRHGEARTFARRFLARYPRSPYFETMRKLLATE
ncbi:MAG TPA: hypothetical protein VJV79_39385 [Polyangiaceae bacterium]|nr:hypothetical protein [Polyangiaceae bacterium]